MKLNYSFSKLIRAARVPTFKMFAKYFECTLDE